MTATISAEVSTTEPYDGTRQGAGDLALHAHDFTGHRLMRLARKIASDSLRRNGGVLGKPRFEEFCSFLYTEAQRAAIDYDSTIEHKSYGSNGGEPFGSYLADIMERRVPDYFRRKSEGHGDRRYGNDNRVVLSDTIDSEPDPEIFWKLATEEPEELGYAHWKHAAERLSEPMKNWPHLSERDVMLWIRVADFFDLNLDEWVRRTCNLAAQQLSKQNREDGIIP